MNAIATMCIFAAINHNISSIMCNDGLRKYTMPRFVTHEAIASGLMNDSHSTANGIFAPWKGILTNNEPVLMVMMTRMEKDWIAVAARSRKAWNLKDLDSGTH